MKRMIQILDVGALTKVIGTDRAQPFVASVFSAQRAEPPQHSRFYTPSALSRHSRSAAKRYQFAARTTATSRKTTVKQKCDTTGMAPKLAPLSQNHSLSEPASIPARCRSRMKLAPSRRPGARAAIHSFAPRIERSCYTPQRGHLILGLMVCRSRSISDEQGRTFL
jgi:hypothetical protein